MSTEPKKNTNLTLIIASAVTLVLALTFYLPRTAVTIQESDGAELAFMSFINGVAHPPGYPLFSLIFNITVGLFPDNPYATIATSSAVFQALAAVLLLLATFTISKSVSVSFAISIAWLIYGPTLRVATDAEVFALHDFLIAVLLVFLALLYSSNKKIHLLSFMAGLASGLAGANHHISVFWAPLIAVLVLGKGYIDCGVKGSIKSSLNFFIGLLLGLLPYLYLIYRIYFPAEVQLISLNSISDFLDYFLRSGYGTFQLDPSNTQGVSYLPYFIHLTFKFIPVQLVLVPLVIVFAFKNAKLLSIGLALTAASHLWFVSKLVFDADVEVHGELLQRFFPAMALYISFTVGVLLSKFVKSNIIKFIAVAAFIAPGFYNLKESLAAANAREDLVIDAELEQILHEIPHNGIFISSYDRTSLGLPYKQRVYNQRNDIVVIIYGMLGDKYYRKQLANRYEFLRGIESDDNILTNLVNLAEADQHKVFSYRDINIPAGYKFIPVGLTWQWLRNDYELDHKTVILRLLRYCSEFNDALKITNKYRIISGLIVDRSVLLSIVTLQNDFKGTEYQKVLESVAELVRGGEISKARQLCTSTLNSLNYTGNTKDY